MVHSRVFGILAITLCLVACLCANAAVDKGEAWKAVTDAKKCANKPLENARDDYQAAKMLLNSVNAYKKNAEEAATEAEKAAKGNKEAEAIAQKAKDASDEALKLHLIALALAEKYLNRMMGLRTEATELYDKATNNIKIFPNSEDYASKKTEAEAIKTRADALEKEINNKSFFEDAFSARNNMKKFVTDAQLAKQQVDAIVAVAKIETLFKSAQTDIKLTEQKRDEMNVTVQEINDLYDNSPEDLRIYIHALHSTAQTHSSSASRAVEDAKINMEEGLKLITQANAALEKAKVETDVEKAKKEVGTAHGAAKNAEEKVEDIKKKLVLATDAATNVLHQKDTAMSAITHGINTAKDSTESPARSGNTMTVSVSLLLTLIACAALH